jgi:hypothetical protein
MKWKTLGFAIALELILAVLAAFGGPHGALGGWPWILQMPGMLLILAVPGDQLIVPRMVAAIVIQTLLWYFVIDWIWRKRAQRDSDAPSARPG